MELEKSALIYDIEIKKAVPTKEPRIEGIEYCDGWHDTANMGVACIGVYDYQDDRYKVFMDDNLDQFDYLAGNRKLMIGFNNIGFDNKVIVFFQKEPRYNSLTKMLKPESYGYIDLLQLIWKAAGHDPLKFDVSTHTGYGLDRCCEVNFGIRKTGHGAMAPVDFQQGRYGQLIDYCLNDIYMTKMLYEKIVRDGYILDPKNPKQILRIE